ncbi:hypothetical protein QEH34_gp45 [Microbacterium phage Footloose]|uniref:Uncharacterized protein n=1 Tax=Microbacterium phage Footloose TaxID=2836048 RepID=A0A8F3EDN6_9CAUD|nr:hypothetical protein QEH34_gp45 [Microbacterium phage Footloose]QWY84627.1 hypothetical protein SEA_FOOTLOOSE_45 [Microbacterium phage Footloose]
MNFYEESLKTAFISSAGVGVRDRGDGAIEITTAFGWELALPIDAAKAVREFLQHEPAQAPPAPTAIVSARSAGKTQELVNQILAQANERGIRVEVVYPQ